MAAKKRRIEKHLQAELKRRQQEQQRATFPPFLRYEHPKEYFNIDRPRDWKLYNLDAPPDAVCFALSDDVAIYFVAITGVSNSDDEQRKELALRTLFESEKATNIRRDSTIRHFAMRADAESSEFGECVLWKVLAFDLMLNIVARIPASEEHLWMPVIERMLVSLRIDRDVHQKFLTLVHAVLPKITHLLEVGETPQLDGTVLKFQRFQINLSNPFAQYKSSPNQLDRIVTELVKTLDSVEDETLDVQLWEHAQAKVIPMIKPDVILHTEQTKTDNLFATPWLADLVLCYAIELNRGFRMIRCSDLDIWNLNGEDLHTAAMENLNQKGAMEFMMMPNSQGKIGVGILRTDDSLGSSYILRKDLYAKLSPHFGPTILAALPGRDSLVVFRADADRDTICNAVREDYLKSSYQISDRLFAITPDGIVFG